MLNIPSHKGNGNQKNTTTDVGMDGVRVGEEFSDTVGGN
jgi:hypothetical protein